MEDEIKEKLTGFDYLRRSLLELSSHPDYDYDAMQVMIRIGKMTTEQLKSLTIIGGGLTHQEQFGGMR